MKILKTISEEIVPLSRRQNLVLLILIACVFQFVLFYAPALADMAVEQNHAKSPVGSTAQIDGITIIDSVKAAEMDPEAAKLNFNNGMSTSVDSSTPSQANASSTPATSTPKVIRVSTHTITAYNSEASQTDDDPCTTANGFNLCKNGKEDTIAANFLKFGTKVQIPELFGDRVFVVRDRMNKRHADRVDVWMKDHNDAIHFGIKVPKIQVIE